MGNFFSDNADLQYHLEHPLMKKIVALKENNFSDAATYDYAPVDYADAMDSYRRVLSIIGQIAADTIAPNAEGVDQQGPRVENDRVVYADGTAENHEKLTRAGVYGLSLPRRYVGLNFSLVPYVMSCDMISRADAGFGNIWGLQDCAETLHEFASSEINDEYLPLINQGATCAMDLTEPDAGSDLQAVMLRATPNPKKEGEWLLNGVKRFITNGDGDVALVLARSEEGTQDARGLSLFVYDKQNFKVKVRRIEHKMGIIGSPTCELVFTDAPARLVGDRKMGLIKYVMGLMNSARLGIGAQSCGIMEAAYREALKYAGEREQFGHPIIEFAAVGELLTNMKARLVACRALLYETARFVDIYKCYYHKEKGAKLEKEERDEMKKYQRLADAYTPLLKLFSSEYSNSVAYDALQIHAGSGFMKDYPIERLYRDARITTIYEGTSQLQVVAAITGVLKGTLLSQMQYYQTQKPAAELQGLFDRLVVMCGEFEKAVHAVQQAENVKYQEFHARRLVEMAGYTIMGHLLVAQASAIDEYKASAVAFVKEGAAKCAAHLSYIENFDTDELGYFQC
ncbi:MAG: acyl-CoA dehydrogenase family protein [Mucinivorans sp.]